MLDSAYSTQLKWAIGFIILALLAHFFHRLHYQRSLLRGLPAPPHSYLLGHLPVMANIAARNPINCAPQTLFQAMKEQYNLGDIFYFDPWPFASPLMVIMNVDVMNELTVKNSFPKHRVVDEFMVNFGGPGNLVSSEGSVWRKWRSAFNPGFSSAHLMTQVSTVIEECQVFCDIMEERAKNHDLFRLEQAATKLTVNIIGKIVLDVDLNAQKGQNVLVDAFNSNIRWQAVGVQFQPSEMWDIRRPLIQRYNNWTMNKYLGEQLEKRFASRENRERSKHVIDLALESYLKEVKGTSGDTSSLRSLDAEFKEAAINNMKTFIFAGHDTTSSTICYALYYLSQNPDALAHVRKEHDQVFGRDSRTVEKRILAEPYLLNKLDYTYAVIREVLRLQPPGSTARTATPGSVLHDPESGDSFSTEGFILLPINVCMHRNPKYWKDPHTFKPERFLPGSTDNKDAWIAFSKGIRNCIGQELAIIETKVILAMTLRRFDFVPAYDEVAKLQNDGTGYPNLTTGVLTQFGERAYQVQLGTAKPNEGMPCRLRLRERT